MSFLQQILAVAAPQSPEWCVLQVRTPFQGLW